MKELPIEKQLTLESFNRQVDQMSREQAQQMLKELMKNYVITKECYNEILKKYMLGE